MLREVEDFARRLNSDWPERMQILSLGQDRRLVPISMNSNGSTQLYTGELLQRRSLTKPIFIGFYANNDGCADHRR
ncbi:hypothetical protein JHK85_045737 [Glycine max]|nr:hypothetical protein JHK85_045737 [Glycine max]